MKFYLPDWEDRVDPRFDFHHDSYSLGHRQNSYENDYYAHQLYTSRPPYDGVLVSISNFESKINLRESNSGKTTIRGRNNIRDYLKVKKYSRLKVMGDCGAFSYVSKPEPPNFYSVEKVSKLYNELGFDFGVSTDHIVVDYYLQKNGDDKHYVKLSQKEKEKRIGITLENAKKFREIVEEERYRFTPIGVAQGYDLNSYLQSVKKLRDFGYEYMALGGLVQYPTDTILKILWKVHPYIEDTKVHLFGVLRPDHISEFEKLGVTSFDSASYFRKAWLRSGQNYLSKQGNWYSAIRVPYSWNKNVIEEAKRLNIPFEQVLELEKMAMESLRKFDEGGSGLDKTVSAILEYDRLLIRNSKDERNLERRYRKTLKEAPWNKCDCEICKSIGVEVIIFRGTNRNKRRGFHNTWTFKNQLIKKRKQDILEAPVVDF